MVADAQAITQPVQLLISGSDWVVHRQPQDRFFERLGSRIKTRTVLPGFFHDTLGERDRAIEQYRRALSIQANHRQAQERLRALGVQP